MCRPRQGSNRPRSGARASGSASCSRTLLQSRLLSVTLFYGPLQKAFDGLDGGKQRLLRTDLIALVESLNLATDGTMVVPSKYLEVVVSKK